MAPAAVALALSIPVSLSGAVPASTASAQSVQVTLTALSQPIATADGCVTSETSADSSDIDRSFSAGTVLSDKPESAPAPGPSAQSTSASPMLPGQCELPATQQDVQTDNENAIGDPTTAPSPNKSGFVPNMRTTSSVPLIQQ